MNKHRSLITKKNALSVLIAGIAILGTIFAARAVKNTAMGSAVSDDGESVVAINMDDVLAGPFVEGTEFDGLEATCSKSTKVTAYWEVRSVSHRIQGQILGTGGSVLTAPGLGYDNALTRTTGENGSEIEQTSFNSDSGLVLGDSTGFVIAEMINGGGHLDLQMNAESWQDPKQTDDTSVSALCGRGSEGSLSPVPEPASMLLLGSGLVVLAIVGRKYGRKRK